MDPNRLTLCVGFLEVPAVSKSSLYRAERKYFLIEITPDGKLSVRPGVVLE